MEPQKPNNSSENSHKKNEWVHFGLNLLNVLGILLTVWAFYWGFQSQIFTSETALRNFLGGLGAAAPVGFILIQIVQTVIPIIPGALTVPMGTMVFGMSYGFILNYTGIIIGSIINFLLARKFGRSFVELIIGEKQYDRYSNWLEENKRFEKIFTLAMFFPFSPDDIICYIAGLSKMTFKKYTTILVLGKPLSIFVYSYGVAKLLEFFFQIIA